MCRRCTLYGKVAASYGANAPTMPCADILHVWNFAGVGQVPVDKHAELFLQDSLAQVDKESGGVGRLVPIQVTGDGNCLAHAISRACHGEEMWYSLLRKKTQEELRDNQDWYAAALPHVDPETLAYEIRAAGELGTYMDAGSGLHLLALANVIKRPLVLMASRHHMDNALQSACRTYLPLRVPQDELVTRVPVIVAWQTDSFLTGAGHFVCVSPTSLGDAVLPANWLPGYWPPSVDPADTVTLARYLAIEGDGRVVIPHRYPPAKIHCVVGDYSSLSQGGPELVHGGRKRFKKELVPAGSSTIMHARLIIYLCNMAEEEAQQMEARETGTVGFNTVPPDSMLAVVLQLYAYMCELPRLQSRYYESVGQKPPAGHDAWASQRLQKCVDDLRTILHRSPALVSRLDHQIDLWSICELQAERALYAQILAENPTLVAEVQLQYRRLEAEEKMVVSQVDARQPGRINPGHVLLRPLIREGEMKSQWQFVQEQQTISDQHLLRKVQQDVVTSAQDQALLKGLPLTPRSPSQRLDEDEGEDDGQALTKAYSAPGGTGNDDVLAEKMGINTDEVEGATRDTMVEHILTLTDIFAVPQARAIPSPASPSHSGSTPLHSVATALSNSDDDAQLQRVNTAPSTAILSETDQQDLLRIRELWASEFVGLDRRKSDGSENDSLQIDDEFNLQVCVGKTFVTFPVHPSTTGAEVKSKVEEKLGPRAAEQVLQVYDRDDVEHEHPRILEDTDTLNGVDSSNTVACTSIHDAKVTGSGGENRGFSRRTEIMMRRNRVMDAVLQGWASVDPGSKPTVVKARLDPKRTSETEFNAFVQDQHAQIRHARVRLGLPTTDMILEQMIAQHTAEVERDLLCEGIPTREPEPEPQLKPQSAPQLTETTPPAEPEPEPRAPSSGYPATADTNQSVPPPDEIEVMFRTMVKGVEPFGHHFSTRATTAQVHAFLEATMAESGMAGNYELKETGFPPRRLVPSGQTLEAAGLTTQPKIVLQVAPVVSASTTTSAQPPRKAMDPPDELAQGGAVYESVKRKYGRLEAGRLYRAPLVRGRSFTYNPDADRLADALPGDSEVAGEDQHHEGQDEANGLAAVWRQMFESEDGSAQLKPGGLYYKEAARSLRVPASGPLNPALVYSFPNPLLQYAGDDKSKDEHTLNFRYDVASDQLVYSHAGNADVQGEALGRTSSAKLQKEALRSWSREDFLQPACLRPGGLLYMNAMDSFGDLTQDKLYYFPHFGPIKADHFKYRADADVLVLDQEEQSDFIKKNSMTINHGRSRFGSGGGGGGGGIPSGRTSSGGSHTDGNGSVLGSPHHGGNSQSSGRSSGSLLMEPEPEPEQDGRNMTDAERAREARLRRYG